MNSNLSPLFEIAAGYFAFCCHTFRLDTYVWDVPSSIKDVAWPIWDVQ
jgi:hypothetical protein